MFLILAGDGTAGAMCDSAVVTRDRTVVVTLHTDLRLTAQADVQIQLFIDQRCS